MKNYQEFELIDVVGEKLIAFATHAKKFKRSKVKVVDITSGQKLFEITLKVTLFTNWGTQMKVISNRFVVLMTTKAPQQLQFLCLDLENLNQGIKRAMLMDFTFPPDDDNHFFPFCLIVGNDKLVCPVHEDLMGDLELWKFTPRNFENVVAVTTGFRRTHPYYE